MPTHKYLFVPTSALSPTGPIILYGCLRCVELPGLDYADYSVLLLFSEKDF